MDTVSDRPCVVASTSAGKVSDRPDVTARDALDRGLRQRLPMPRLRLAAASPGEGLGSASDRTRVDNSTFAIWACRNMSANGSLVDSRGKNSSVLLERFFFLFLHSQSRGLTLPVMLLVGARMEGKKLN
jgi:hypothetical protein